MRTAQDLDLDPSSVQVCLRDPIESLARPSQNPLLLHSPHSHVRSQNLEPSFNQPRSVPHRTQVQLMFFTTTDVRLIGRFAPSPRLFLKIPPSFSFASLKDGVYMPLSLRDQQ